MKLNCLICTLVLPLIFNSTQVIANNSSSDNNLLVVTEYLSPFQVKNAQGELDGYSVAVVKRLLAQVNESAEIKVFPWVRAYHMAKSRPNVLIFSMARTQPREPLFHWLGTLVNQRFYIWGLGERFKREFASLDQARGYNISVSKGYDSAIFLQQKNFTNLSMTTNREQAIAKLLKGRTDLILSTEFVLREVAKKQGYDFDQFKKLYEITPLNSQLSIALSKGTAAQRIHEFRYAFDKLVTTGELATIKHQWQIFDQ